MQTNMIQETLRRSHRHPTPVYQWLRITVHYVTLYKPDQTCSPNVTMDCIQSASSLLCTPSWNINSNLHECPVFLKAVLESWLINCMVILEAVLCDRVHLYLVYPQFALHWVMLGVPTQLATKSIYSTVNFFQRPQPKWPDVRTRCSYIPFCSNAPIRIYKVP